MERGRQPIKRPAVDAISLREARKIGRALLRRRQLLAKTQGEIGALYGRNRSQISDIERGEKRKLSTFRNYDEFLVALARQMGREIQPVIAEKQGA